MRTTNTYRLPRLLTGAVGGSIHPKLDDWNRQNPKAHVGDFAKVAEFGELVVLAVKGSAAAEALRAAGAANVSGKTVIDATNPLTDDPPVNGVHSYFTSLDESLMERLQEEFPEAHFVKAFNQVNNGYMVNPNYKGGKPNQYQPTSVAGCG